MRLYRPPSWWARPIRAEALEGRTRLGAGSRRLQTPSSWERRSDPWDELRHELIRGRRYRRPFALARIPAVLFRPRAEVASDLSTSLRRTDRLWTVDDAVYLLLPESDRGMAEALLTRIGKEASVVVFPLDGVTSGALLAALEGHQVGGHAIAATWLEAGAWEDGAPSRG